MWIYQLNYAFLKAAKKNLFMSKVVQSIFCKLIKQYTIDLIYLPCEGLQFPLNVPTFEFCACVCVCVFRSNINTKQYGGSNRHV